MKTTFLIPITAALCLTMATNAMADCSNADSDTYSCVEFVFDNQTSESFMFWFEPAKGIGHPQIVWNSSPKSITSETINPSQTGYGKWVYSLAIAHDSYDLKDTAILPVGLGITSEVSDFTAMRGLPIPVGKQTIKMDKASYCVSQKFKEPKMTTTVTGGECR